MNITSTISIVTCNEVKEDVKFLYTRLIHANREEDIKYYGLVKYLLQRLEDLLSIKGGELNDFKLLSYMKNLEIIKHISEGNYNEGYKSKWLGIVCTTKKMDITHKFFKKEVGILDNLCHPNLLTYYFARKGSVKRSIDSFVIKDNKEYLYTGMELMQKNLMMH